MDTIGDSCHRRKRPKLEDLVKVTGQQVLPALTESLGFKEMRDSAANSFEVKFASNLVTRTNSLEGSFDVFARVEFAHWGLT
jgi:hypothetical protein